MSKWIEFFIESLPALYQGALITIQLTLVGLALGIVIGLPAAIARVYGRGWIRRLAVAYIEIFRGTPVLVQLFVVYHGLPDVGIVFSRLGAAYLVLGLNSGAYQAEYFRGAIQAVGSGQMMAARSIGLSRIQAIRYIILPQALRMVLPAWSNEPIALMKASAIAFLIAVPDLMTEGKIIAAHTYRPIDSYLSVALIYLVLVFLLARLLQSFETRLQLPGLEMEAQRT
ncbi:MAG: amino acid ABC transporter permease [Anaerolineales bacterium]